MNRNISFLLVALWAFGVTTASAQGFYGAAEVSFGTYAVDDTGSVEGTGNLATFDGFLGAELGTGLFAEGEFRFK